MDTIRPQRERHEAKILCEVKDMGARWEPEIVAVLVTSEDKDMTHKCLEPETPVISGCNTHCQHQIQYSFNGTSVHSCLDFVWGGPPFQNENPLIDTCKKSRFTKDEARFWQMTVVVDKMGADKATNGLEICHLSISCLCLTYRSTSKFLLTSFLQVKTSSVCMCLMAFSNLIKLMEIQLTKKFPVWTISSTKAFTPWPFWAFDIWQ